MSITRDGKLRAPDTNFGRLTSVICFDADFPQLLAQAGDLRADIVLDPSNDWKAIDPWHTQMASFRAIEQGVNLVRHTSLGFSAAFDYQGRPLATMDHYLATERALVSQVPTRGARTPTRGSATGSRGRRWPGLPASPSGGGSVGGIRRISDLGRRWLPSGAPTARCFS